MTVPDERAERAALLDLIEAFNARLEQTRVGTTVDSLLQVPLTIKQLRVLGLVMMGEGRATSHALASALGIFLATMSGIVDRLGEHGMVERRQNPADLRAQFIVPTVAGVAVIDDLVARNDQMRRDTLDLIATEDLRALVQGLDALGRALRAGIGGSA